MMIVIGLKYKNFRRPNNRLQQASEQIVIVLRLLWVYDALSCTLGAAARQKNAGIEPKKWSTPLRLLSFGAELFNINDHKA
jgi:hypothetical protein